MDEDFLRDVFRLRDVLCHPQAEAIDAAVITPIDFREGLHVAVRGSLRQLLISALRRIANGCGHRRGFRPDWQSFGAEHCVNSDLTMRQAQRFQWLEPLPLA